MHGLVDFLKEKKMTNYELPQMKYPEQKGLISIIVPIYNTGNNLKECLDSILSQTFATWEAILVDDGSTDNTREIVDEYAKKDSRFIAIYKQNGGTLLARKTGLENSKGEFIANIDSDDKYNPQCLEKIYAKITETNADFVWYKFQVADEKHHLESHSYFATDCKWNTDPSENIAMALTPRQGPALILWNKLIKREIYAKVSFPRVHLTLCEDPVQMLQVVYHSKSAQFVSENLYFYRADGSTTSGSKPTIEVIGTIFINKTLENLFNGNIPLKVKNTFYCMRGGCTVRNYFLLNKEIRMQFKNEIEPILPGLIKAEKNLNLKICLFLASKGIEFPFKFREFIRKYFWLRLKQILKKVFEFLSKRRTK
jgi:glycosyltransferase involved in cell wall biosynthesis